MIDIKICDEALDASAAIKAITSTKSGGINVFIGTVRSETSGKKVVRLEFEAYHTMAVKEMRQISNNMLEKWPLHNILIHHRTGVLEPGEMAVIIAVSAAHRDAAFEACRYAIDTLKKTVPIWKKEIFEDGEEWVGAYP